MASLLDIVSKGKNLKPTATVVRGRDGRVKVERKELLSSAEREEKIAASVQAGKIRGELKEELLDAVIYSNECDDSSRIFPTSDGEIYEFYPDHPAAGDDETSRNRGEWMVAGRAATSGGGESTPTPLSLVGGCGRSINVATFNVWFDEREWKRRTEALVDLLVNVELIDVICLQEVTPRCLGKILEKEEIRKAYRVTDKGPAHKTLGRYGVAMLIRRETLPVPDVTWVTLPTRMGRSALVASFETIKNDSRHPHRSKHNNDNDDKEDERISSGFAIATVHLESLASQKTRAKQLKLIRTALRRFPAAILVGDYNISSTGPYGSATEQRDLISILEGYDDLWVKERGTDGDDEKSREFLRHVTYNSTSNAMLKASKLRRGEKPDHARLDRVFVRFDRKRSDFEAGSIRIISDQPIGPDLYISDHFGLAFEVVSRSETAP